MSTNETLGELFGGELNSEYLPDDISRKEFLKQKQKRKKQLREQSRNRAASTAPILQEVTPEDKNVVSEIKPDVVLRFGGTLPFDSKSTQLQCGETVTSENGDTNLRLNMECILTFSELEQLQSMRTSENTLKVVSNLYSGVAMFDQLKFDRIPESNETVYPDGTTQPEARYTVQLQSKEKDDDSMYQPFTDDSE